MSLMQANSFAKIPAFVPTTPNLFWDPAARAFVANSWQAFLPIDLRNKYASPPTAAPTGVTETPPGDQIEFKEVSGPADNTRSKTAAAGAAAVPLNASLPEPLDGDTLAKSLATALTRTSLTTTAQHAARAFFDAMPPVLQDVLRASQGDASMMWTTLSEMYKRTAPESVAAHLKTRLATPPTIALGTAAWSFWIRHLEELVPEALKVISTPSEVRALFVGALPATSTARKDVEAELRRRPDVSPLELLAIMRPWSGPAMLVDLAPPAAVFVAAADGNRRDSSPARDRNYKRSSRKDKDTRRSGRDKGRDSRGSRDYNKPRTDRNTECWWCFRLGHAGEACFSLEGFCERNGNCSHAEALKIRSNKQQQVQQALQKKQPKTEPKAKTATANLGDNAFAAIASDDSSDSSSGSDDDTAEKKDKYARRAATVSPVSPASPAVVPTHVAASVSLSDPCAAGANGAAGAGGAEFTGVAIKSGSLQSGPLVDSGASRTMWRHRADFEAYTPFATPRRVELGDGRFILSHGVGTLRLGLDGLDLLLRGVLWVPDLAVDLVSVATLTKAGHTVRFTSRGCVLESKEGAPVEIARQANGLYRLTADRAADIHDGAAAAPAVALRAAVHSREASDAVMQRLHRALGHMAIKELRKGWRRGTIQGLPQDLTSVSFKLGDKVCPPCIQAKHHEVPDATASTDADGPLHIVHSDLSGILPESLFGKFRYFIVFVDRFTKFVTISFLVTKDGSSCAQAYRAYRTHMETQLGVKIRIVRTDNGLEFRGDDFHKAVIEGGAAHQTSAPYTHRHNGPAERMMRTLHEAQIAMLADQQLPVGLWPDALQCFVELRNRVKQLTLKDATGAKVYTTPFTYVYKRPSVLSDIHIFGCDAWPLIPEHIRVKGALHSTPEKCIYLGPEPHQKAYRLWSPSQSKLMQASTCQFYEPPIATAPRTEAKSSMVDVARALNPPPAVRPEVAPAGLPQSVAPAPQPTVPSTLPSAAAPPAQPGVAGVVAPAPASAPVPAGPHGSRGSAVAPVGSSAGGSKAAPAPQNGGSPQKVAAAPTIGQAHSGGSVQAPARAGGSASSNPSTPSAAAMDKATLRRARKIIKAADKAVRVQKALDAKQAIAQAEEHETAAKRAAKAATKAARQARAEGRMPSSAPPPATAAPRGRNRGPTPRGATPLSPTRTHTRSPAPRSRKHKADRAKRPSLRVRRASERFKRIMAHVASLPATAVELEITEPATARAAWKDPDWRSAMNDEISNLRKQGTFSLLARTRGMHVLTGKWIFKVKKNADGTIDKRKARYVIQGFRQKHGVDFTETYAPTSRYDCFRLVHSIAAELDHHVHVVDVKCAFLQSRLTDTTIGDIHAHLPYGYSLPPGLPPGEIVAKLNGALYGLKQAPREWHQELRSSLLQCGFQQLQAEESLYTKWTKTEQTIVLVYVDDILISSNRLESVESVKALLRERYPITDKGEVTQMLGITVDRDRASRRFYMSQRGHIERVISDAGLQHAHPELVPMQPKLLLKKVAGKSLDPQMATYYRSLVGQLTHIARCTRPDIAYAVGRVSQFAKEPAKPHLSAVEHIVRYLKGTIDLRLALGQLSPAAASGSTDTGERGASPAPGKVLEQGASVLGFSDSDYANDMDKRRSYSGFAFFVSGGIVSWSSKRQSTPALSTTEAEYMALSRAAKEAQYLRSLLEGIGLGVAGPVDLCGDNQGAIALCKNPGHHDRSKHIHVRYHHIRHLVKQRAMTVRYVQSAHMLADIFTKALPAPKLQADRVKLGLFASIDISQSVMFAD